MRSISEQGGKDILVQVLTEVKEQREELRNRMAEFSVILEEFSRDLKKLSSSMELIRTAYVNLGTRLTDVESGCLQRHASIPDNGET